MKETPTGRATVAGVLAGIVAAILNDTGTYKAPWIP